MHHEMIRVFRFLLKKHRIQYLPVWSDGHWRHDKGCVDSADCAVLWDIDDPRKLPHEIVGMFNVTDPEYLRLAFRGIEERTKRKPGVSLAEAIDILGMFIEHGVRKGEPDGSGFHETMHEFIAAHERMAAQGAAMNKIIDARFNDYFWSIHLWIDGQYGRLLLAYKAEFDTSPLDPDTAEMFTHGGAHGAMPAMSMA
jgi:hypothetical protein